MKKIAVVTGASSGMGREFAVRLAKEKQLDEMWVIARRADRLEALKTEISVPLRVIPLDLTQEESIATYAALLEAEKPEVSVLVNAGGVGLFGTFADMPLEDLYRMIDLNSKAYVGMTYATLSYLTNGSEVYQLDSLSSFQPVPYICVYGATKAFVLSFSRALNVELKSRGIHMMAVCPGWVRTEFFDHAVKDDTICYYNKFFTSEQVITRALRDMKKRKDVSVCGFSVRAQVLLTKLLPHRLIMKIWCRQQKK